MHLVRVVEDVGVGGKIILVWVLGKYSG